MARRWAVILGWTWLFLVFGGAVGPVAMAAEVRPTPTPGPLVPPPIIGVNPNPVYGEGGKGEAPGGVVPGPGMGAPAPGGQRVAPPPGARRLPGGEVGKPVPERAVSPEKDSPAPGPGYRVLAVPQRWQGPADPTCGVASLAMVLGYYAGGRGPGVAALAGWLKERGLLYPTGTGVEELAYLARALGYRGSAAFAGWDLARLRAEVAAGRPVVVNLGASGGGGPGHLVVVVGFSEDGQRVVVRDPQVGLRVLGVAEFEAQWAARGRTGLVVRKEAAWGPGGDPMARWVGLLSVVAGLSLLLGWYGEALSVEARRRVAAWLGAVRGWLARPERPGLGAGLRVPVYREVVRRVPVYREVTRRVPVYGWVWKTRYRTVRRREPVYGWVWRTRYRTVRRRVPVYRKMWGVVGWRTRVRYVREVRYRVERQTVWQRAVRWVRGLWGWFRRVVWKPVVRWVRKAYTVVRKVVERVPVYGWKVVQAGWRWVEERIPERVKVWAQTGWKWVTERIPERVKAWVRTGWRWVTERIPERVKVWAPVGWKTVKERVQVGWRTERKRVQVGWKTRVTWEQVGWRAGTTTLKQKHPTPVPVPTPPPDGRSEGKGAVPGRRSPLAPTPRPRPRPTPVWTPRPRWRPRPRPRTSEPPKGDGKGLPSPGWWQRVKAVGVGAWQALTGFLKRPEGKATKKKVKSQAREYLREVLRAVREGAAYQPKAPFWSRWKHRIVSSRVGSWMWARLGPWMRGTLERVKAFAGSVRGLGARMKAGVAPWVRQRYEGMREGVREVWARARETRVGRWMGGSLAWVSRTRVGRWTGRVMRYVGSRGKGAVQGAVGLAGRVYAWMRGVPGRVKGAYQGVREEIRRRWQGVVQGVQGMRARWKSWQEQMWKEVRALPGVMRAAAVGMKARAGQWVRGLWERAGQSRVGRWVRGGWAWVSRTRVGRWTGRVMGKVGGRVRGAVQGMAGLAGRVVRAGYAAMRVLPGRVKGWARGAYEAVRGRVSGVWGRVANSGLGRVTKRLWNSRVGRWSRKGAGFGMRNLGWVALGLQASGRKEWKEAGWWLEKANTLRSGVRGLRQVVAYAPEAWRVLRGNRATIQKWAQAAAKVGKWGRFLGKASGVASAVFGMVDAYQGYQKFRNEKGYKKWAGLAQSVAGAMSTLGGVALLTGAGAPVAAVAFGVAAVASGVSAALEIASDPEKREQIKRAVNGAKEKVKEAGRWVKTQVQSGVRWVSARAKEVGRKVKEGLQQAGEAIGSFFRKAGGLLSSLVGGRG